MLFAESMNGVADFSLDFHGLRRFSRDYLDTARFLNFVEVLKNDRNMFCTLDNTHYWKIHLMQ